MTSHSRIQTRRSCKANEAVKFCDVPIQFSNDPNSLEYYTFAKYFLMNKNAPAEAKIIITEDMIKVYNRLCKNETRLLTLEGPPGSGKTTTLIWLYHQIQFKNGKAICIPAFLNDKQLSEIRQKLKPKETVYIFSDFHDMNQFTTDNWRCWSSLLPNPDLVFVVALSSGFHLTRALGSRELRSKLGSIYHGFEKYIIHKQTKETLVRIGKEFGIATSDVQLKEANGLPRFILVPEETMPEYIDKELTILMQQGIQKELLSLEDNLRFLIALRHKCCTIGDLGFTRAKAERMIPVLANFVYINDKGIPTPIISINDATIKCIIKAVRESIGTVHLSEEAVIGYSFEVLSTRMFENEVFLTIDSSVVEIGCLAHSTAVKRIELSDSILVKNILYRCVKSFIAIDFVAITDIDNIESLLVIQVSVQATNHNTKIEKSLLLSNVTWRIDGSNVPEQVVYLYLNPNAHSDAYANRLGFFQALRSRCNSSNAQFAHIWKYAEIDLRSRHALESLLFQAQHSLLYLN